MLKLLETELIKLRRRIFIWLMLPGAIVTPFFAMLYFKYQGKTGIAPALFYKWSTFGYTMLMILPVILGILCSMLMYDENQNDMLKQLFIVPVSKIGYLFSKFFVVFIYSVCFMLINAIASVLFSVLSGIVIFEWGSVLYVVGKCLEIGILAPFGMIPILALAASQKGYILPICITLVYAFLGSILMGVNMYLHPLSSMAVIIDRSKDIPGILFTQEIHIPFAFLCIAIWGIVTAALADLSLRRRK